MSLVNTWCLAEIRPYHLPGDLRMRNVFSHGRGYINWILVQ